MVFYRFNELSKFRGPSRCVVGSAGLLCAIISILQHRCNIKAEAITEVITRLCEWPRLSRPSVSAPTAGSAGLTIWPGYSEWIEGLRRFHI